MEFLWGIEGLERKQRRAVWHPEQRPNPCVCGAAETMTFPYLADADGRDVRYLEIMRDYCPPVRVQSLCPWLRVCWFLTTSVASISSRRQQLGGSCRLIDGCAAVVAALWPLLSGSIGWRAAERRLETVLRMATAAGRTRFQPIPLPQTSLGLLERQSREATLCNTRQERVKLFTRTLCLAAEDDKHC